jgi:hypothetical protein
VAAEATFRDMQSQLRVLQEALEALGTTVEEDKPKWDDVVVASNLSDAVLASRGLLEETRTAADDACRAVEYPFGGDRARRALALCQEQFQRFAHHFSFELASYERVDDIRSVGEERGQDWLNWASVVKQGLEQSRALVEEIRNTLFLCWQELAERIATASVSIQNTTIGQVSAARLRDKAAARESGP